MLLRYLLFIGFELVLAYGIEFNAYGCDFSGFSMWQTILHWVLTCAVWLFGAWYVVRDCARNYGVDIIRNFKEKSLLQGAKEMSLFEWALLIIGTVLSENQKDVLSG